MLLLQRKAAQLERNEREFNKSNHSSSGTVGATAAAGSSEVDGYAALRVRVQKDLRRAETELRRQQLDKMLADAEADPRNG